MGGHWVCTRQTDIMELIQELGIEYYPQNIEGRYLSFLHSVENSEFYFFLQILGTKIMQVGNKSPIRTYNSQIPSIGTLRGLIDLQRYAQCGNFKILLSLRFSVK